MPNETKPIFTINRPNLSCEDQRIASRFATRFDQLSRNQKYAILIILERGTLKHHYEFELIPQPSPVTCTAACIATVLGRDENSRRARGRRPTFILTEFTDKGWGCSARA
ncbi:MAG: hypothetical protein QNK37_32175 [Acidobacteriota bacterium]|nr:hypothetical protein [Acidobacteriota bacterium]